MKYNLFCILFSIFFINCHSTLTSGNDSFEWFTNHYKTIVITNCYHHYSNDTLWHDMVPCMPGSIAGINRLEKKQIDSLINLTEININAHIDSIVGNNPKDGFVPDLLCVGIECTALYNSKTVDKLAKVYAKNRLLLLSKTKVRNK